jgi:hypothetical protein
MGAPAPSMVALAALALGLRKKAKGTRGAVERRSMMTKATSRAAAAARTPTVWGKLFPPQMEACNPRKPWRRRRQRG